MKRERQAIFDNIFLLLRNNKQFYYLVFARNTGPKKPVISVYL